MIKKGFRHNRNNDSEERSGRQPAKETWTPLQPGQTVVKAFGDHWDDGAVQMSFTLPVPLSEEARVAATTLMQQMNFEKVRVINMEAMGPYFTYFVVYASCPLSIDMASIHVPKLDYPRYSFQQVNEILSKELGRKIIVLGACIGTDAHTVGIDAIFNMKGYLGDYGLERYSSMKAINLRAQVAVSDLINKIVSLQADAVLISRVVTQGDQHIDELKLFLEELVKVPQVPKHLIKVCGGPRITHKEAIDLGYDAGFGPGTKPSEVASYLTTEMIKRLKN